MISGFIMGAIALDQFGSVSSAIKFAKNRIARIVPIYWIMTTAAIGIIFSGKYARRCQPERSGDRRISAKEPVFHPLSEFRQ